MMPTLRISARISLGTHAHLNGVSETSSSEAIIYKSIDSTERNQRDVEASWSQHIRESLSSPDLKKQGERTVTRAQRDNCGYRRRLPNRSSSLQQKNTTTTNQQSNRKGVRESCNPTWYTLHIVSNSSPPPYNRMIQPHTLCPLPRNSTQLSP